MTRREFLATLGLMTVTSSMNSGNIQSSPASLALPVPLGEPRAPRGKSLRIAHLTDAHVEPGGVSAAGLRRCLEHVHNLERPPDIILNGGDSIMDAFRADQASTLAQWEIWHGVLNRHNFMPIQHCLGNHDVQNDKSRSPTRGKNLAMDMLHLTERYYSIDLDTWRLIVLDSTLLTDGNYLGRLDEQQYSWLESELAIAPAGKPIIVLSHIPILSACAYFDGDNEKESHWRIPGQWMHIDARRIKNLFGRCRNVRLCLSGHIHLQDRVEYNGVTYLCNGAVCGDWWQGSYQECPPGYSIVDLYADGTFDHQYLTYG
jgi:hypothetical protein